jgi:hypothetical protein
MKLNILVVILLRAAFRPLSTARAMAFSSKPSSLVAAASLALVASVRSSLGRKLSRYGRFLRTSSKFLRYLLKQIAAPPYLFFFKELPELTVGEKVVVVHRGEDIHAQIPLVPSLHFPCAKLCVAIIRTTYRHILGGWTALNGKRVV